MGKLDAYKRQVKLLAEIEASASEFQPEMNASTLQSTIVMLEGPFIVSGPEGPFDCFDVRVATSIGYPMVKPLIWETADRIPRTVDRHVFPSSGTCCIGVWEEWLLTEPDLSFRSFLAGPLHSYFVSQSVFERTNEWPFGDRSHGLAGVIEAYSEILGVQPDPELIRAYSSTLAQEWPKGHGDCPCGSGLKVRQCHQAELMEMHRRVPPAVARMMFDRLKEVGGAPEEKSEGTSLAMTSQCL